MDGGRAIEARRRLFLGEIAFATGRGVTATVTIRQISRVLALDQEKLRALCKQDQQIASATYHLLGGGLADKLHASNERHPPPAEAAKVP